MLIWTPGGILDGQQTDTLDLRDYLAVLRRRRWIVVQTVVVVVAVAFAVTFAQTPQYESEVRLVVESNDTGEDGLLRQLAFGQQELETQRELVTSRPVAEIASSNLVGNLTVDDLMERIDVSLVGDTQILEIRATSTDPEAAAAIASAFADAYLEFRRQQALDQLVRANQSLDQRTEEAQERLDEIENELRGVSGSDQTALELEQQRLQDELAGLAAQRSALSGSEVFARGGGQIVMPAEVPEQPFSPKPLRTGVLALVLGLMLGVGLAFLRDFFDDAIRSDEQAAQAAGASVLSHIPAWPHPQGDRRLVSVIEPSSPVSEAYRTLRTNVRFLTVGSDRKSILVTSALEGEGKTTTAGNLAVAMARAGTRALLVGSDLRKPTIHDAFGIDAKPGLSDVLVGDAELVEAIVDVGVANLRVMPGGSVPPNPAELLGSPAMIRLMEQAERIADIVIYDGPPVLAVADALELGTRVGGTILVIDAGETGRHAVRAAASRMSNVGMHLHGIVLNNVDPEGSYGYGYYYADYRAPAVAPGHEPPGIWAPRFEPRRADMGSPAGPDASAATGQPRQQPTSSSQGRPSPHPDVDDGAAQVTPPRHPEARRSEVRPQDADLPEPHDADRPYGAPQNLGSSD